MLMLVTEKEAKKKWCPFSRAVRSSQGAMAGVNRDGPRADPRAVCLASECLPENFSTQAASDLVSSFGGK